MDYYSLMIKKEIWLAELVNHLVEFVSIFHFKENSVVRNCLKKEKERINTSTASLILNAPSINQQNLLKLANTDVIFVNRGFKHPLYKELHPKYHVFCDPKLKNGIWPLSWIDEIVNLVPNITFVMPVEWKSNEHIQELNNKNINICWIKLKDKPFSPFVAGYTLSFLLELGYNRINVTGWEANGLGHELIRDISHFYGKNEENNVKGSKEYILDFYMYMLNYSYYRMMSKKAEKNKIKILNMTLGGCMDMFERDNLLNPITKE